MKNSSKEVVLNLDLPEFSAKDVKVKIARNAVAIEAEKKQEKKIQKKGFFHKEKSCRSFKYATTLPEIEPKKAKVKFSRGKLQIILPKKA